MCGVGCAVSVIVDKALSAISLHFVLSGTSHLLTLDLDVIVSTVGFCPKRVNFDAVDFYLVLF